jgi:hypothetical protein
MSMQKDANYSDLLMVASIAPTVPRRPIQTRLLAQSHVNPAVPDFLRTLIHQQLRHRPRLN